MSDAEGFQWVLGKVARVGSHGTQGSGSYLGTGGLRSGDGKISALVYDTQAISPEEADRLRRGDPPGEPLDADESEGIAVIGVGVGVAVVAAAGVYAVRNREQIAEKVSVRIMEPLKEKLRQLRGQDESALLPESRQIAGPTPMPAELQGILDQVTVRRPQS